MAGWTICCWTRCRTPPRAQWNIAGALTAEFFAGQAAREGARTVFAVGDRKQSVYSFQGADPAEFDRWRDVMRRRVEASAGVFRDTALDVSFRSTAPVLALVDAVFADPGGRRRRGAARHAAARGAPRRPCRAGGAVGRWRRCRSRSCPSPGRVPDRQPWADLRAAAPGGWAGALDPRADRRDDAGKPRPSAGGRRRADPGPPPRRVRPAR